MAVRKSTYFLVHLLSILLFYQSHSQDRVIGSHSEKEIVRFFSNGNINNGDYGIFIIRDLALALESNISQISVEFALDLNTRVVQHSPVEYELRFLLVNANAAPIEYKDFNISQWIAPSSYSAELMISDTLGVPLKILQVTLTPDDTTAIRFSLQRDYGFLKPEVIKIRCLINKKAYEDFNEGLLMINNYYASVQALKIIADNLEKVFSSDSDVFDLAIEYAEALRASDFIFSQDFTPLMIAPGNDPGGIKEETHRLRRLMIRNRTILNNKLPGLKSFFTPSTESFFSALNLAQNRFADIKFDYNHRYTYFFDQIARVKYSNAYLQEIVDLTAKASAGRRNNPVVIHSLILTARKLVIYNLRNAQDLIEIQDYTSALVILEKTEDLCSSVPSLKCPKALHTMVDQCKTGIFSAYMGIAERAVSAGQNNLAMEYLLKARNILPGGPCDYCDYRINEVAKLTWNGYISSLAMQVRALTDHKQARNTLERTREFAAEFPEIADRMLLSDYENIVLSTGYDLQLTELASELEAGHLLESELILKELREAPENLVDQENISKSQVLLDQKFFSHYFSFGRSFLDNGKPELALDYLELASYYAYSQDQQSISAFQSYLSFAASEVCLDLLRNSVDKLTRCESGCCQSDYDHACELAENYDLLMNENIIALFYAADHLNDSCYCVKVDNDFQVLRNHIEDLIQSRLFSEAIDIANSALLYSFDTTLCVTDLDYYTDKLNILGKALQFEDLLESKLSLLPNHPYDFIQQYQELKIFYDENDLKTINVPYSSYSDYLSSINDLDTLRLVIDLLLDEKHAADALRMLYTARSKGFDPVEFYYEQQELATMLADLDYQVDSLRNPYYKIDEYTRNEKWYRVFRDSYLESWRFNKTGVESSGFATFMDEFSYKVKYKSKKIWQNVSSFLATLPSRVKPIWSGQRNTL